MQIKELTRIEEISLVFPLISKTYENLTFDSFQKNISEIIEGGYKMAGIFDSKNKALGVIGIRISKKLNFGKILEIEDLAFEENEIGEMLVKWAEEQASKENCQTIFGNLDTKRFEIHKIFSLKRFILEGLHFRKQI